MKWTELTPKQQSTVIDYDVNPESIAEDSYYLANEFRESLKSGHDAIFITYETLVDWWDNCDDETQKEILDEGDDTPTGSCI